MRTVLSNGNARLAAARGLTHRRARRAAGRFLAEGVPAVQEAVRRPDTVVEVFATADAAARHAVLLAGQPVSVVSDAAAAQLSETTTPQGLVAVCRRVDIPPAGAFAGRRLAVVLVEPNDPGNLGTVMRTADAAGADLVVVAGDGVDVYNGKAVRASAGSVFHVDLVVDVSIDAVVAAVRGSGLTSLATTAHGSVALPDAPLSGPTLWWFGSEAHGLPTAVLAAADTTVRVPIHGAAESLNLAAAAAVCLYASAFANRPEADA